MRRWAYWCGVALSLTMVAGFGAATAPYYRIGAGPVVQVGPAAGGRWSVTTVRVKDTTWFQWAAAELTGERLVRAGGGPVVEKRAAMDGAQTSATLVAAQLAARRIPIGAAGLQVTDAAAGLRPGDIVLAAGDTLVLTPLRAASDLPMVAGRPGASLRVLVVPRTADGSWGAAETRRVPGSRLAMLHAVPDVSAVAYGLGEIEGPSAGLILALARLDALTAGDLTGGRRIAGTGSISLDGTVTNVGEVGEKAKAAVSQGAGVFFVPALERDQAVRAARGTTTSVVAVGSVAEAVRWLCAHGGQATIC
jgi:PDZ domain-containing secreted protein